MKYLECLFERKNLVRLMLCVGLFQVAGYYLAAALSSLEGGVALPQPDTLLYCQAARRIVEGHPLSFSAGTEVCTGTTSVLYPFILAIPYALGCTGETLLLAGFVLNALFYLVFLWGWGSALCQWMERGPARVLAALLLALAGHPAYCSMAQSDIGCWLALSGLLAAGLATDRRWLYGLILIVGPWVRPEGMVCVVAFAVVVMAFKVMRTKDGRGAGNAIWGDVGLACLALASVLGVFGLNALLTGHCQFSSVTGKGYFDQLDFPNAVYRSVGDLLTILRETVLGLSGHLPRGLIVIPLLGGISVILGVVLYPWKKPSAHWLPVLMVASLGGILTVANSGWQDTNYDRYIVWMSPLVYLFCAVGVESLSRRIPDGVNRMIPSAAFVLFSIGGALTSIFSFAGASRTCEGPRLFARECESVLPREAGVGASGYCGLMYELSPRRCAHLPGIYSPEFQTSLGMPGILEILQNEPQTRFDYWLERFEDYRPLVDGAEEVERGIVLTGPNGFILAKADWEIYERSLRLENPPQGLQLVDRVDVAYERDEKRCQYEVIDRYGRAGFLPFYRIDKLGNHRIVDSGRVLAGGDAMSVCLQTNRAVTVVMRTCPRQKATMVCPGPRTDEFSFSNPLSMRVAVEGRDVGCHSVSYATNGFSDVSFTIPAAAIVKPVTRISFLGDHIACCYWFYQ